MIKLKDLISEITSFQNAMADTHSGGMVGFNHILIDKNLVKHTLGSRVNIIKVIRQKTPKAGAGTGGQHGDAQHRTVKSIKYDVYIDEKFASTETNLARAKRTAERKLKRIKND